MENLNVDANGESEEHDLQSFVRIQMISIISPVAEHVREVQDQVQELRRDLAQMDDRERGDRTSIDKNCQEIVTLRDSLKKLGSHVEQVDRDAAMSKREKDRLEAEHEVTKSDLSKIAGNLRTSNVLLKAVQQKTEDLDGDMRSIHSSTSKIGRSLMEHAEKLAQVQDMGEALNERHLEMVKELSDVARTGTDTQCSLQQLVHDHGKAKAALPLELGRLEKLIDSLNSQLGKVEKSVSDTSQAVSNTDVHVRLLQESLDHQDGASRKIDELTSWKGQAAALMKDTLRGVADLEARFDSLTEATNNEKDLVASSLRNVENTLDAHNIRIEQTADVQHKHGEQLRASEHGVGQLHKSLYDLAEKAQLLSTDQKHLRSLQNDTANKLESHRITLSKTQADLEKHGTELDHSKSHISNLRDGIAATNSNMSKLGSRIDFGTKNITDMTKAFQDVSQHVSRGDHGLLRPKSPRSGRLPDIAGGTSPRFGAPGH